MKKFLIGIIIILIILLLGQLIYFNFRNNNIAQNAQENISSNNENNNMNNRNQIINFITNSTGNALLNLNEIVPIIEPTGIDTIIENYSGDIRISELEEEFYKFIYTDVSQIYQLIQKKSVNQILQIYDLNTNQINSMHIYSAEDFLEISRQVLQVGSLYTDSYIDLTTYNQNEMDIQLLMYHLRIQIIAK